MLSLYILLCVGVGHAVVVVVRRVDVWVDVGGAAQLLVRGVHCGARVVLVLFVHCVGGAACAVVVVVGGGVDVVLVVGGEVGVVVVMYCYVLRVLKSIRGSISM